MPDGANFFEALTPFHGTSDSFDARYYAPAPDDWLLAVTDVESSTRAVETGRYQLVNLIGAAGIAAVRNVCRGETIPFLFGWSNERIFYDFLFKMIVRRRWELVTACMMTPH